MIPSDVIKIIFAQTDAITINNGRLVCKYFSQVINRVPRAPVFDRRRRITNSTEICSLCLSRIRQTKQGEWTCEPINRRRGAIACNVRVKKVYDILNYYDPEGWACVAGCTYIYQNRAKAIYRKLIDANITEDELFAFLKQILRVHWEADPDRWTKLFRSIAVRLMKRVQEGLFREFLGIKNTKR